MSNLRDVGRSAVRSAAAERAIRFLDEKGFDESNVDDIAAAAGMSTRSFFRYFSSKEDVVIGELLPMGELIRAELQLRPAKELPFVALRAALRPLEKLADANPEAVLRSTRVALSTPALRARTLERHATWADMLAPLLAQRTGWSEESGSISASAITHAAMACLYVATTGWVEAAGRRSYAELIDESFTAVRRG
jgi:AcrR family transcriptional regulator